MDINLFEQIQRTVQEEFPDDNELSIIQDVISFLSSNAFFNQQPHIIDKKLYVTKKQWSILHDRISTFLHFYFLSPEEKADEMIVMLKEQYPVCADSFDEFCKETQAKPEERYHGIDFFLGNLKKDITEYTDPEIESLAQILYDDLPIYIGQCVTFYLSWLKSKKVSYTVCHNGRYSTAQRQKYKVKYHRDYVMQGRVDTSTQKLSYSETTYLSLVYYLLNEEYAKENEMYLRAADSKEYTDAWLYLSLHFICALRDTDLERIYHPHLHYPPGQIIEMVKSGTYTSVMAKAVSSELMHWMYYLAKTPNKTKDHTGIPNVKFFIPASLEEHFGILLSLAEAHHQLHGLSDGDSLIHRYTSHKELSAAMGDDIGEIFLEQDFSPRRANKSYLQSIESFADPILANAGIHGTKGYMMASLARSHKGGYAEFARTTSVYLKDANFNGLSAEFVAKELFERGVLSSIVSMLLQIITGGEYKTYSVSQQTALIQAVGLKASAVESLIDISNEALSRSEKVVNQVLALNSGGGTEMPLTILHKLAIGDAPSREEGILCILCATIGKCPFANKDCYGCSYEVGTKSAAYHLMSEYKRIKALFNKSTNERERDKYQTFMKERLLPLMQDMMQAMDSQYGTDYVQEFVRIIQEAMR